ncbi:MAG: EamA family transporter [Acidobacteriia bacterium]|nr:EamA family transporter [Terriglobia bacterium]
MPGGTAVEALQPAGVAARRVDLKTRVFAVLVVFTNVVGNFSMSWGLKHQVVQLGLSPLPYIRLIFSPWVLLGTTLLILWLLLRMTLLGWADLSYILPVTAFGYVLNAVLGRLFLGEVVSWQRWMGTLLIVIGIALVAPTAANTTLDDAGKERRP